MTATGGEAAATGGAARDGRVVRLVAVALGLDPDRVATHARWRASLDALVDRHVEPHPRAPTLVAFPEHTGLLVAFLGSRAAAARDVLAGGGGAADALVALAAANGEAFGRAAARFPEVRSPGQLLFLARTDTLVRGVVEAFGTLARERGLWVSVGAALPDWERVLLADAPEDVVLADPDGDDGRLARATSAAVRNRNLVFAPDGALVAVQDKAYLTPVERDQVGGLGLAAAGIDEVAVADLPIGRVGSVISKDAWMPDVNERLEQLGAQLLVQPEAFDRWGLPDRGEIDGVEVADLWPPDKFQRGGWWMVQRHRGIVANLAPMLVGGIGELTFDGQPLVAVAAPGGVPGLGLLGQPADPGWAAVGRWWMLDEPAEALTGSHRRVEAARLAERPHRAVEGGPADGAAWADVVLPRPGVAGPAPARHPSIGTSVPVAAGGMQLVPQVVAAADGATVWCAWVQLGGQRVVVARGDGRTWEPPTAIAPATGRLAAPFDRQWRPSLAVTDGHPVCAYLGFPAENHDLFAVLHGTEGWGTPVRVDDAERSEGVLRERGHDTPRLVAAHGAVWAVWSDLRWPWVLPSVRWARSTDGGRSWSPSRRADGGPLTGAPDPLGPRSDHGSRGQAVPDAVAVPGGLLVAWQELDADGVPAVWLAAIGDVAARVPVRRVSVPGEPSFRPRLAAVGEVIWLLWERDLPGGGGGLVLRRSGDGGRRFDPPVALDRDLPPGAAQRRAAPVALPPGPAGPEPVLLVVAEDDRDGVGRIVAARVSGDGAAGTWHRIDDAPDGVPVRAPAADQLAGEVVAVWQDARGGSDQLRGVRLPVAEW